MSRIVYKPHCEKCGSVIEQDIKFKRNKHTGEYTIYEFDPWRCAVCGAVFDSAEVPIPKEVDCD